MGPNLAPWGPLSPSGAPKRAFRSQNGPFWGPWSAVEVCKGAQAHDMDAYHPDTLCGSVLDASRPVSAVPRNQRGPKGALGQKFQFCHGEKFSMGLRPHLFLSSLLTQKSTSRAFLAKFESMFLRKVHFFVYPIWAQNGLFLAPRAPF